MSEDIAVRVSGLERSYDRLERNIHELAVETKAQFSEIRDLLGDLKHSRGLNIEDIQKQDAAKWRLAMTFAALLFAAVSGVVTAVTFISGARFDPQIAQINAAVAISRSHADEARDDASAVGARLAALSQEVAILRTKIDTYESWVPRVQSGH